MSGSIITCPHCQGRGRAFAGRNRFYARPCMVCADDRGDWSQGSPGKFPLPITDAQAEVIYELTCDCCADLVAVSD